MSMKENVFSEMVVKMAEARRDLVNKLVDAYILQETMHNKTSSLREIAVNTNTSYWKVKAIYLFKKAKYMMTI